MPAFIDSTFPRRRFFKSALIGSAFLALRPAAIAAESEFHIVFISDTHIPADANDTYRGFKPCENLKRIAPEVVEAKPELVIHCGDVARLEGKVEDYQQASSLLEPITSVAPACMAMGNHDDRVNFAKVFQTTAGEKQKIVGKHVVVFEHPVTRFVVLDSLMFVNKGAGQLGKGQRGWLAKILPTIADRPVVIVVHHSLGDNDIELVDVDALFEMIRPHTQVKAIFYGHSHVWSLTERQNVKLINLPAVGYNFQDKEPVGWVDARFNPKGVELVMHAFGGNTADNGKKFSINWA